MNTEQPVRKRCDIVMKGGITSGVVYPKAITRLAERYDFINIGGTSAGAIAAAIAAAAQYRRAVGGGEEGFAHLGRLPEELGRKTGGSDQTRLFTLFQANGGTRRLFEVAMAGLGGGSGALLRVIRTALVEYPTATSVGGLPGFVLLLWSALHLGEGPIVWAWLLVALGLSLGGAVIGALAGLVRDLIRELPRNGYGLCSGVMDGGGHGSAPPLTAWLEGYLNETAGLPKDGTPLTFRHLWGGEESDPERAGRRINLEMMTTNISHGRPYRLPFRDDEDLRENHLFYFRPDEFRRLFPAHIVQWMIDHPRGHREDAERIERRERLAAQGYLPLPAPADLPVIVATRMSLSFPILLSAVPLHRIDRSVFHGNQQPERCWFSDGGLCSNFPLHFFDAAVPRRPTFSIDLTEKPNGTDARGLRPEMDEANGGELTERWNRFETEIPRGPNHVPDGKPDGARLAGFVMALIRTMQNWTDATQSRLPGFRDRIVRVPLTGEEGGLNLDMPAQRIEDLTRRGEAAAALLIQRFDVPAGHPKMTWDNHRWIRLRAYLASQEKSLAQLLAACGQPENGDKDFVRWLDDLIAAEGKDRLRAPSYPMSKKQMVAARDTLKELQKIQRIWTGFGASHRAPRPRPELRPRAQI
jgi:predicted acylesterase/phospholipase RssA